jgi:hypothetical protein
MRGTIEESFNLSTIGLVLAVSLTDGNVSRASKLDIPIKMTLSDTRVVTGIISGNESHGLWALENPDKALLRVSLEGVYRREELLGATIETVG